MSEQGHIVDKFNRKTVEQKNKEGEKDDKTSSCTERGLNQTDKRPT